MQLILYLLFLVVADIPQVRHFPHISIYFTRRLFDNYYQVINGLGWKTMTIITQCILVRSSSILLLRTI